MSIKQTIPKVLVTQSYISEQGSCKAPLLYILLFPTAVWRVMPQLIPFYIRVPQTQWLSTLRARPKLGSQSCSGRVNESHRSCRTGVKDEPGWEWYNQPRAGSAREGDRALTASVAGSKGPSSSAALLCSQVLQSTHIQKHHCLIFGGLLLSVKIESHIWGKRVGNEGTTLWSHGLMATRYPWMTVLNKHSRTTVSSTYIWSVVFIWLNKVSMISIIEHPTVRSRKM